MRTQAWIDLIGDVSPEGRSSAQWECVLFKVWLKAQPRVRQAHPPKPKPILSAVLEEPAVAPAKLSRPIRAKPKQQWRPLVKEFMRTRTTPATLDDIALGLGIKQEVDRLRLASALHHMGDSGLLRKVGEVPSQGKSRAFTLWKLAVSELVEL